MDERGGGGITRVGEGVEELVEWLERGLRNKRRG